MNKLFEFIERKRLAYHHTFMNGDAPHLHGERVLADLRKFCGVDKGGIVISPINRQTDPYATAYRAGQRDVYARIVKFLNLKETEVLDNGSDDE